MALNQQYIESSIDNIDRIALLNKKIKLDTGSFVDKKQYLNGYQIAQKLTKNGYSWRIANEIASYIKESIQHAFERGIFVVSSRTVALKETDIDSAHELINFFKGREPEYFNALLWYRDKTFVKALESKNYHHNIANELGPYILRHVRVAFSVGMKTAAQRLISIN